MESDEILLKQIRFGSLIKLNVFAACCTGLALGVLMFILSLLGADVSSNLGQAQYQGVKAGIVAIFLVPLVFSIFGIILSLFIFFPLGFGLKWMKGLKVKGHFEMHS